MTAKGTKAIMPYQHKFENTYLYGSYSPITGDRFVWEINGVSTKIFEQYLKAMSKFKPQEYKIVIIDNTGYHPTKHIQVPKNISLLNIPAYSPELNPCEQIWQVIKQRYKLQLFKDMNSLKKWLYKTSNNLAKKNLKSMVGNQHYKSAFCGVFNS